MTTATALRCLLLSPMLFLLGGCLDFPKEAEVNPATNSQQFPRIAFNTKVGWHSRDLFAEGKHIFRSTPSAASGWSST